MSASVEQSIPTLPIGCHQNLPQKPCVGRNSTLHHQQPDDTGRIIFTRQLWQRTMPDTDPGEQIVLNKSQAPKSNAPNLRSSSRRTSSTQSSSRSHKHSPSPSRGSKTPLTPEESPPFTQTRKRDASIVALEDKEIESIGTPAHRTGDGEEATAQVCICQPDPKIPRPRNGKLHC